MGADAPVRVRLDKWLWQARLFKTRSLAARQVAGGHVRLNGHRVVKPAQAVGPGDVLTFARASRIRVVRIKATGLRRGPADEAQALFADLGPGPQLAPPGPRYDGGGRPSGRDRRRIDQIRGD